MSPNVRGLLKSFFPEKKESKIIINDFILFMFWDWNINDWNIRVSLNDDFAKHKQEQDARIQTLF
jgi:hypothetical protein